MQYTHVMRIRVADFFFLSTLILPNLCIAAWENSLKLGAAYEHFYRESPVADISGAVGKGELALSWTKNQFRWSSRGVGESHAGSRDGGRRSFAETQEFFFEYAPPSFTAQLGINSVTWGVTDFHNPLDVVNARRYESFTSPVKRGAPMVRLEKGFGRWILEGLWIPNQLESKLPGETSRWFPRDSLPGRSIGALENQGTTYKGFLSAEPTEYSVDATKKWNDPLKNNYGFRLSGGFGEVDTQLIYFEGANISPQATVTVYEPPTNPISVSPEIIYVLGPRLLIKPQIAKYRTTGAAIAPTVGPFIFKVAFARSQALDKNIDLQDTHSWVSSAETTRNFWGLDWTWMIENLQVYDTHAATTSPFDTTSIFSINEALNQSWLIGTRVASGLSWTLSLGAQLSTTSKGGIGLFSFEKRLSERMQGYFNIEYIDGETGSSLHLLRSSSKATTGFNFSW